MNNQKKNNRGFTLIELMVSLSVIAILMVLAAPSWRDQTAQNRLVANTNKLVGALAFTRSEAVKQGLQTTLCSSDDLSNASPSCTSSAWQDGWLIWTDLDDDGSLDSPGEIVRMSEATQGGITITPSNTLLAFNSTGFTTTPGTFKLCDSRVGNTGRQLRVLISGSTSLITNVACP